MSKSKLKRYSGSSSTRLNLGRFGTFIPSGPPVYIGDRLAVRGKAQPQLRDVTELGTSRTIKLVVGLNRGVEKRNTTGRCAYAPRKFRPASVDETFLNVRGGQVGLVGATRTSGRGWYQSAPEPSVTYEVAYIPSDEEPTFAKFKANIDRLAERIAERHCQDSVLVLRDDGSKRTVALATGVQHKDKRR